MPDVGDTVTATLTVDPFDATTAATLAVTSPGGVVTSPPTGTADNGRTWTASVTYTAAGLWRLKWTVTGTGASVEHQIVSVAPAPGPTPGVRVYATTTDLANYLRAAPPLESEQLLEGASRMLDSEVLRWCRYDVDDDGMPTHPDVKAAIGRAVCAQVAWWDDVGDSRGAAGVGYGSVSIGSVNLGRSVTSVSGADSAARQIAPQVWDELQDAALHDLLIIGGVSSGVCW